MGYSDKEKLLFQEELKVARRFAHVAFFLLSGGVTLNEIECKISRITLMKGKANLFRENSCETRKVFVEHYMDQGMYFSVHDPNPIPIPVTGQKRDRLQKPNLSKQQLITDTHTKTMDW